ncbi:MULTISPECIES: exodeoxyribonuclease VII small subunit [Porphyromonas]|uniref:Uncharacterized protein n=1 Tax=Porphyromonas canoris TaxID=36875 RepID=A0ABR4XM25_9PORP|nr:MULTISPECIES: exodeoxyribonuclease VII small subunit [Porphyromonas]MDO4789811.1 exodeoxyribonuclease VII small subunit [Porphyromonas sp.]KGL51859.1 hypothetical protein HQ29_07810 [Porphyromonas canoris]KGN71895.1 hypothetical protein JT26_01105 [Porphyromonas sp. COT-108 OH1349]KGN92720.1 hypothetical protein HQ43_04330 [Porphyromonas canoris]KGN94712.1 hypothetical protein HQ39_07175 [Porphyromonas sp. COT-108 OH2963]
MAKKKFNYTQTLKEIEENLSLIERNELPIEEILKLSRATASMIKECKGELKSLQEEIDKIVEEIESNG